MNLTNILTDFVDLAEKNRKYPPNTAAALKAAINKFSEVLNEEEQKSIDTTQKRFDSIYHQFYEKNKQTMTASSINTYRNRLLKTIRDYLKYGQSPEKMESWTPKTRKPSVSTKEESNKERKIDRNKESERPDATAPSTSSIEANGGNYRTEIPLKKGRLLIAMPMKIYKSEAILIANYLEFLKQYLDQVAIGDDSGDVPERPNGDT